MFAEGSCPILIEGKIDGRQSALMMFPCVVLHNSPNPESNWQLA